jgi:hypothetical protein
MACDDAKQSRRRSILSTPSAASHLQTASQYQSRCVYAKPASFRLRAGRKKAPPLGMIPCCGRVTEDQQVQDTGSDLRRPHAGATGAAFPG